MMDVWRGEINEERPVGMRTHPVHHLLIECVAMLFLVVERMSSLTARDGRLKHFFRKRPRLRLAAIFQRIGRIESDNPMVLHPYEGRMAVHDRNSEEVIKTALERPGLQFGVPIRFGIVPETEVPFAKTGRGVALALQHGRQRRLRHINHQRAGVHYRSPEILTEGILARE